ncbi:TPA: hypothetical protein ACIVAT_000613 [Salmonella enterica subsp. enterica serovar Waycross]
MIIEETENAYAIELDFCELIDDTPALEVIQYGGNGESSSIGIDKQQAIQLIAALQEWVDGGEVE